MGHRYEKVDPENDWLPQSWRLTAFPIAKEPAESANDIIGTAFLVRYEGKDYLISASHVVTYDGSYFVFPTKIVKL